MPHACDMYKSYHPLPNGHIDPVASPKEVLGAFIPVRVCLPHPSIMAENNPFEDGSARPDEKCMDTDTDATEDETEVSGPLLLEIWKKNVYLIV